MSINESSNIKKLVIVGGGTAGWMTASALSKVLGTRNVSITLIESEEIGTIGVGEATIPQISLFNSILGLDENEFIRATQATFKLGIEFVNWGRNGDSYIHPFSNYGTNIDNVQFYHYWQKAHKLDLCPDIEAFSLNVVAARQGKFMRPKNIPNSPLSKIGYAFHFDAALYAKFLRRYGEERGVQRIEGIVEQVELETSKGFIQSVVLKSGQTVEADFFIDCTGFNGVLIEGALKSGYEDWSNYLPCDRAVAVPSKKNGPAPSYTRATAHGAGWQWRIPLQHRVGNGHVFSSRFMSDDEAESILLKNLEEEPLGDPRFIRFKTGKRKEIWKKNCLSIGLSSGFLEPLESTSIHLIQSVISKFISLFPTAECHQAEINKFNEQIDEEFLGIRDFLILHYAATERNDTPFWNYCRTMELPELLREKIDLYRVSGRMYREKNELFDETSWLAVMHGQGVQANGYNPIVDSMPLDVLSEKLRRIHSVIGECARAMPEHEVFIRDNQLNGGAD